MMTDNPNDPIRETMLEYFHERNTNATSVNGKKGSRVKISDAKRELKDLHGLTQQQVMANLTYLIDSGWVERVEEERSFRTSRGTQQPSTSVWYTITAKGIDLIEGDSSAFRRKDPFAGINITAVGSIVQVGDGNYANSEYADVPAELDALREAIAHSPDLDETTKLSTVADIETVKAQLAKPEPNRSIVRTAWSSVYNVATVAGLAASATAIAARLDGLL